MSYPCLATCYHQHSSCYPFINYQLCFIVLGESTDLGNTFWQAHLAKNKKTYLVRGLVNPSTEVLIPRPRFYKALDRGFFSPRSRYLLTLGRGINTSTEG